MAATSGDYQHFDRLGTASGEKKRQGKNNRENAFSEYSCQ
jgi:hypothetical protein